MEIWESRIECSDTKYIVQSGISDTLAYSRLLYAMTDERVIMHRTICANGRSFDPSCAYSGMRVNLCADSRTLHLLMRKIVDGVTASSFKKQRIDKRPVGTILELACNLEASCRVVEKYHTPTDENGFGRPLGNPPLHVVLLL